MKKFTIYLIFFPLFSFSQNVSDSVLANFYNKGLDSYFSNYSNNDKTPNLKLILIRTDFDTSLLLKNISEYQFKYYSMETPVELILPKPLKKNIGRKIFSISHKIINTDTIDINIYTGTISNIKNKKASVEIPCGGTFGYIPFRRFIYLKELNSWKIFTNHEILDAKAKEEEQFFQEIIKKNRKRLDSIKGL